MDRYSFEPLTSGTDEAGTQRNNSRDSLFLAAKLTVTGLPPEQVRVRNLSAGGLMAEYPSPIGPGTTVLVDLRGVGEIRGRIAWATDGRIGIAFDTPIDPLLARKPVGSGRTSNR